MDPVSCHRGDSEESALSLPGPNVAAVAGGNDYGIPHHPERFQDVTLVVPSPTP